MSAGSGSIGAGGAGTVTAVVAWVLLSALLAATLVTVLTDPSRRSGGTGADDSTIGSSLLGMHGGLGMGGGYDALRAGMGMGGHGGGHGMLTMEDNSFDGPRGSMGSVNHLAPGGGHGGGKPFFASQQQLFAPS